MCRRCEGYSWEEIERELDLMIRVHGYAIQAVEPGPDSIEPPWSYTIGLAESWRHPEFVVLAGDVGQRAVLIRAVVDDISSFLRVATSTKRLLDVELVPVHPSHFADGLVAQWEQRTGRDAGEGDFLQIALGRSWYCECCFDRAPRLDVPAE